MARHERETRSDGPGVELVVGAAQAAGLHPQQPVVVDVPASAKVAGIAPPAEATGIGTITDVVNRAFHTPPGGAEIPAKADDTLVADDGHTPAIDGWFDAGDAEALSEGRARVVHVRRGERIALYRHKGALCAMSNVCAHQGGPLGEGRVIEGCATCPWHGYQYLPLCGLSPPPFTEKIETHRVRIRDGRVQIEAAAQPPGTPMTGARIEGDTSEPDP